MSRPPRIPVLLPIEMSVMYFLTICVKDRKPVLANQDTFAALQEVIARLDGRWIIRAATLMPDHLHLLVIPYERDASIGNLSAAIKRWMRQILKAEWQWQEWPYHYGIDPDVPVDLPFSIEM